MCVWEETKNFLHFKFLTQLGQIVSESKVANMELWKNTYAIKRSREKARDYEFVKRTRRIRR